MYEISVERYTHEPDSIVRAQKVSSRSVTKTSLDDLAPNSDTCLGAEFGKALQTEIRPRIALKCLTTENGAFITCLGVTETVGFNIKTGGLQDDFGDSLRLSLLVDGSGGQDLVATLSKHGVWNEGLSTLCVSM